MPEIPAVKDHREALFNGMKAAEDAYVECLRGLCKRVRSIVQNPVDVTPEDVGVWMDEALRECDREAALRAELTATFKAILDHVTVDSRGVIL